MTVEQVRDAVGRAARQAFKLGQQQARARSNEAEQLGAAVQYAEMLVLPSVELALDQAGEEGATAVLAARHDPEPDASHG